MKTAEQAVHDMLWKIVSPLVDKNIHEGRPMSDIGYPFADFENFESAFIGTKSGPLSSVRANLNIWDEELNRLKVSDVCIAVFREALDVQEAYGYRISLRVNGSGIKITQDRTVTPSLWRGIINLTFDIL